MRANIEAYIGRVKDDIRNLEDGCEHLKVVNDISPSSADSCEECLKVGSSWVTLRLCLTCGNVACCDSSVNQHARKHFEETGHPVILSYEHRELWMYCFADDKIFIAPE